MEATKAEVIRNDGSEPLFDKWEWLLTLENQGKTIETTVSGHRIGILLLEGLSPEYTAPKDVIKILTGCFEEGSNLEEVLGSNLLLNEDNKSRKIDAIAIKLHDVYVFVTKDSHNPDVIYGAWEMQNQAKLLKNIANA